MTFEIYEDRQNWHFRGLRPAIIQCSGQQREFYRYEIRIRFFAYKRESSTQSDNNQSYICKELGFKHFPLKHTPNLSGEPDTGHSLTLLALMEIGHSILYRVLGLYCVSGRKYSYLPVQIAEQEMEVADHLFGAQDCSPCLHLHKIKIRYLEEAVHASQS